MSQQPEVQPRRRVWLVVLAPVAALMALAIGASAVALIMKWPKAHVPASGLSGADLESCGMLKERWTVLAEKRRAFGADVVTGKGYRLLEKSYELMYAELQAYRSLVTFQSSKVGDSALRSALEKDIVFLGNLDHDVARERQSGRYDHTSSTMDGLDNADHYGSAFAVRCALTLPSGKPTVAAKPETDQLICRESDGKVNEILDLAAAAANGKLVNAETLKAFVETYRSYLDAASTWYGVSSKLGDAIKGDVATLGEFSRAITAAGSDKDKLGTAARAYVDGGGAQRVPAACT